MQSNQQPDPELETFDLTVPSTVSNSSNKLVDSPQYDSVDIRNGRGLEVIVPLSPEASPASKQAAAEESGGEQQSLTLAKVPTGCG